MTATEKRKITESTSETFALGKRNYRILIIGILVVVVGYILMIGGGSDNPNEFSREIFSFRRITLAPIVVLIGYGVIFYSILTKKKFESSDRHPNVADDRKE